MNSESIYAILASKPHNEHYLKRYLRFIEACRIINSQLNHLELYLEEHHICPKSNDLFPEYLDLKKYHWNSILLTDKQHIIAHVILMKAYGGLQTVALHYMINIQNVETNYNRRKIPTSIQIRYSLEAKRGYSTWRRGKATYKDSDGNKYFLETDDPQIQEKGLVGQNDGIVMSEEARQAMRDAKFPNKRVEIFNLTSSTTVGLFSDEFSEYLAQGWTTSRTSEDYETIKKSANSKNAEFWTGRARYMTRDGVYHGSYLHEDPIVKELDLIPHRTQKQNDQLAHRTKLATERKLGTRLYTNGIEERFCTESPGDGWYLGRKPRDPEWERKRKEATAAKFNGTKVYNDGVKQYYVKEGDYVDPSWILGMKKQKEREFTFTDGVTTIKCTMANKPEGFVMLKYFKK